MITLLGLLLAIILFALSGLHLYWAFGGDWGFDQVLPYNEQGKRMLNPGKVDCVAMAIGFCSFAVYYLIRVGLLPIYLSEWLFRNGAWALSAVFALRALGDFKYLGFTKRITNTDFARLDTRYYSTLCALLAIGGVIIGLMN